MELVRDPDNLSTRLLDCVHDTADIAPAGAELLAVEIASLDISDSFAVLGSLDSSAVLEEPIVRYNGIYISHCHYIRQGLSENTFTQPIHLVYYYRYLRFFDNGSVLGMVTTESTPLIREYLQRNTVATINSPQLLSGTFTKDSVSITTMTRSERHGRTVFHSELEIRPSRRHGPSSKLIWKSHHGIFQGHTRTDFSLQNFRSFYFSPDTIES